MEDRILEKVRIEQKRQMKKFLVIVFAVGIICTTFGVAAGSYNAKQMNYTPSDSTWKVNNVSDALDSIKFNKTADNYSTDEKVVGTWIDGKPLYQRVIETTSPTSKNSWQKMVDLGNTFDIQFAYGWLVTASGEKTTSFLNTGVSHFCIAIHQVGIGTIYGEVNDNAYVNRPATFIVKYTKTTDNASN